MWDRVIRSGQVHCFLPLLETVLDRFGRGGRAMPSRLEQGDAASPAAAPTAGTPSRPPRSARAAPAA
jgi:hypothetical protein